MMRRWMFRFGLFLVLLGLGGLIIAVSGIVPIKASSGHWGITEWFLQFGKKRSVATHTIGLRPPPLDDPSMVLKGAGHYQTACMPCHGSPVQAQPRVAAHMLPRPPNLRYLDKKWDPEEVFHIVKHGIKLTGMPAWPSPHRDDEVWAMVAFLQTLPGLGPEEYQRLAGGNTPESGQPPLRELAGSEPPPRAALDNCARCHGYDGLGRGLGAFPKLAGQKEEYLLASLEAYAQGTRYSGIMEPIAAGLKPDDLRRLARYYAAQPAANSSSNAAQAAAIERGRRIASEGVPRQGVPACIECHSHAPPQNPIYPRLHGQYADYLTLQLELFSRKQRGGTPYAHLMHFVATRLTPEQQRDVAAYFASGTHDGHSH